MILCFVSSGFFVCLFFAFTQSCVIRSSHALFECVYSFLLLLYDIHPHFSPSVSKRWAPWLPESLSTSQDTTLNILISAPFWTCVRSSTLWIPRSRIAAVKCMWKSNLYLGLWPSRIDSTVYSATNSAWS